MKAAENAKTEMANLEASNQAAAQQAREERDAMMKEAREIKEQMIADASGIGTLTTPAKVVIGKDGKIDGTLECSNADIEGAFSGNLKVSGLLSLKSSAHIEGDVVTNKLAVEPGATFNASCSMNSGVKSLNDNGQQGKSA